MKILLLESYYGGSHKTWADQLKEYTNHDIKILGLPARHWKWRMVGSAFSFLQLIKDEPIPDILIATSMMDLSTFKASLSANWSKVKFVYYMHENQLSYPKSINDQDKDRGRDHHYGLIQFKSMVAADAVVFNSKFNQSSFFENLKDLFNKLPDHQPFEVLDQTISKSSVLYPGVVYQESDKTQKQNELPCLLWNHRWEYDKNPNLFFKTLFDLKKEGLKFELIVLGKAGSKVPPIFAEAQKILAAEIIHWGYEEDYAVYMDLINRADLLPVTNKHDFFGISVIEAGLSGVQPLLPMDLVYPEHFPPEHFPYMFYKRDQDFIGLLRHCLNNEGSKNKNPKIIEHLKKYLWAVQIPIYDTFFESLIRDKEA